MLPLPFIGISSTMFKRASQNRKLYTSTLPIYTHAHSTAIRNGIHFLVFANTHPIISIPIFKRISAIYMSNRSVLCTNIHSRGI